MTKPDYVWYAGVFAICTVLTLCTIILVTEHRTSIRMLAETGIHQDLAIYEMQGGFWSSKGYFCVRTDSLVFNEKITEYHEACHELIDKDREHFCEYKEKTNWRAAMATGLDGNER